LDSILCDEASRHQHPTTDNQEPIQRISHRHNIWRKDTE
jgi:hypothetical protein